MCAFLRKDPRELNNPITSDEILNVRYREIAHHKSPGMDGIPYEMYKKSFHIIGPGISNLFNAILDTAQFPQSWCDAIVIPLYKSGDRN